MKQLLTPKLDFVFKKLFTEDTRILISLLNTVLMLSAHQCIRSAEIRNPGILPEDIARKFIVLDIRASDETGRRFDIEMQARKYAAYPERALYYLAKMYGEQLDAGEAYDQLSPVIGVHFLDYELFPIQQDYRFCFELRDVRHPDLRLTDNLSLHIFELPKPRKRSYPGDAANLLEWIHFFNHAHEEREKSMRTHYTNPMIHGAFGILETLSADDQTRLLAEMREKALKDEASMLSAARREGMEKSKRETALNLLSMGKLTVSEIALVTRLAPEAVEKLKKSAPRTWQ